MLHIKQRIMSQTGSQQKRPGVSALWRMLVLACSLLLITPALAQEFEQDDVYQPRASAVHDPYENWNRQVFSFNEFVDRNFLKPVASTYRKVTPEFVRNRFTDFFSNLGEIRNFSNSVLRLDLESSVTAAGRFTYNTVFGLGGLFDVATVFQLPEKRQDFGMVLGHYGVNSGPFLMLPLLGPSNPRDLTGFALDLTIVPTAWDYIERPEWYALRTMQVIDIRSELIPAEGFITGDRYTFIRNAYMQRRDFLINEGRVTSDPFADDDDWLDDF